MSKCKYGDWSENRNKCGLYCHLGELNPKIHFVAKQGLEEMRYLKQKVKKKKRSETKCGRPNMALHLNE